MCANIGRLLDGQLYGLRPGDPEGIWLLVQPPTGRNSVLRIRFLLCRKHQRLQVRQVAQGLSGYDAEIATEVVLPIFLGLIFC